MCGIVGVIGSKDPAYEVSSALFNLQHRGQDAAGITVFNSSGMTTHKDFGLVAQVFNQEIINSLKGDFAIGHTRYPTAGCHSSTEIQPFYVEEKGLALGHNGNIANSKEIKKFLQKQGVTFLSTSDTEVMLQSFNLELSKFTELKISNIFTALKQSTEHLNGSYSIICGMQGRGILGFRDPYGIRPLVLGKRVDLNGTSYAMASETAALEALDYSIVKDIQPGEAVFITPNLKVTMEQLFPPQTRHCMFEWVYFSRADSVQDGKGVYETRLWLGRELAKQWKKTGIQADIVMPVPETAKPAAIAFAEDVKLPYREGLLKNAYMGRTFIMSTPGKRSDSVRLKLHPVKHEIQGKRIALIDDSIVRGTTSKKIVQLLRDAGAREVHFLVACPPIKYPCFYGIDMSTRAELIAAQHPDTEEIRREIGADSLTYQTMEGLTKAIGLPKEKLCTACLDKDYPTKITPNLYEVFQEQRANERSV